MYMYILYMYVYVYKCISAGVCVVPSNYPVNVFTKGAQLLSNGCKICFPLIQICQHMCRPTECCKLIL